MKNTLLLLFLMIGLSAAAQSALPEHVLKNIQARIDNGHSPSIVVGIIDAAGPKYYFFGTATMDGEAVNEHSIYEIGSISKTFTGILLAEMVRSGKVTLDDPVQQYLPESVKMPKWENREITLGHLSDHTSSLPRLPSNLQPADMSNPYADYTVEQLYECLSTCELTREIGSQYEYSNLAQGLLGHVLAKINGKSYEELMIETIAEPLGMKETKIKLNAAMQENLAPGHNLGRVVSNWDIPTLAGAGAIRSSLHDMLIYLSANMGLKESPLHPAMQMSHEARHDKAGQNKVGLGWHIAPGAEGAVIWHNGGTGGYRTFAGFVQETGKGVVVLTNSSKGADDIGFHLLNPEAELQVVQKSLAAAIRQAVEKEGPTAAWPSYTRIKASDSEDYDSNESEINSLGYYYLQNRNPEAALAVFKVNVDAFPASSNVYDSYGEALMKAGKKEAAVENYQRSLALNPGNTNAVEMLKQLGVEPAWKEITVNEGTLESYVGTYELQPGFNIEITRDGAQLFGQATGQGKFELFPKSDTEFYLKVVEAQVEFTVEEGQVTQLILHQGGQHLPGKKIR